MHACMYVHILKVHEDRYKRLIFRDGLIYYCVYLR